MRPRLAIALVALLLAVGACGDSGGATSTAAPTTAPETDDVVFGGGELPDRFPADFPVPSSAVIGSTLVTPNRTEVAMVVAAPIDVVAAFFEGGIPDAGFDVDNSEEGQFGWTIAFSDSDREGSVVMTAANQSLTQLVVRIDAK